MKTRPATAALLLLAACTADPEPANVAAPREAAASLDRAPAPPAGSPGAPAPAGRPEPAAKPAAQDPAEVVRTYYRLLGEGRHAAARRLWSDGGDASGMSEKQFAAAMLKYQGYEAEVGAPAPAEGAAGSLYVEVPVRVRGIVRGEPFLLEGPVTLRRCNDVPGCTAEQRQWRIAKIGVRPRPQAG